MVGGTRSYEMARRFVAKGHEVHVVSSDSSPKSNKRNWTVTVESGIHIHWFPVAYSNSMGFASRLFAFFRFALAALRKSIALKGDVIFASSTPLTIAIPAVFASKWHNVPMVFEVRDLWPEIPIAVKALRNPVAIALARFLETWAYKNSAAVVALSPGIKAGVVSAGYSEEKVAVIPNGSDNNEFSFGEQLAQKFLAGRPWLKDKPLLVYAGTFGLINGVGYMVELASALLVNKSDIRILLVGSGAELSSVTDFAERAGVLRKNLFIEDPLPKNEIPGLLSAATAASVLFLDLPEMRNNSANKFFDTLASRKPVLLNYGGWMHELVVAHGCGLPAWQMSVGQVAEILDDKLHDGAWLDRAGLAARCLAERYFDRDQLADQLMAVLQAAVEGDPQNSARIAPGTYV